MIVRIMNRDALRKIDRGQKYYSFVHDDYIFYDDFDIDFHTCFVLEKENQLVALIDSQKIIYKDQSWQSIHDIISMTLLNEEDVITLLDCMMNMPGKKIDVAVL